MTGPDRTDELLRAMLERRAAEPMPDWLLSHTMQTIARAPQAKTSRWPQLPSSSGTRLALVAATVLLFGGLAGGALVATRQDEVPQPGQPTPPVAVEEPTPGGSAPVDASPTVGPVAAVTPRPQPVELGANSLAVVTSDGDGLRVRSAPGTGPDSTMLTPLLPARTRMLVVSGPVQADGYDWYEVLSELEGLYGWVAAGKDGVDWVKPTTPECSDSLDDVAVSLVSELDFLTCYGDSPVSIDARLSLSADLGNVDEVCPWTGGDVPCDPEPAWLWEPRWFTYSPDGLAGYDGSAAIPPELLTGVGDEDGLADVRMTIAMDSPEAASCRLVDAGGRDVIPRGQAIARCRMTFVVQDLELFVSEGPESLRPDSLAAVGVDLLDVWSAPADEAGSTVLYSVNRDALLYVDTEPHVSEDGGIWHGVLPEDPSVGRYGWVRIDGGDEPSLYETGVDCADPADWAAFNELSTVRKLVCTDDEPVTVRVDIRAQPEEQPTSAFACTAFPYVVGREPCQATPTWLAAPTGVDVTGLGSLSFPAVDPSRMAQADLPGTQTSMDVTGVYEHPASSTCRAVNPLTGEELMVAAEAAIYCRSRFVIQAAEPAE